MLPEPAASEPPQDGALHTPRSAQAVAFVGIVVGVVAAFMTPYFLPLMLGCYAIALLTVCLCWREIREMYRRLWKRRKGVRLAIDTYFVFAVVAFQLILTSLALATHDWTGEDLRGSFELVALQITS